jgi:hypothetical protein
MADEAIVIQPPNIYQKLNLVRAAVGYVQKDAVVDKKYKAVSHDMVTALVRPALVEHGIIIVPNIINQQTVETGRKTSSGSPIIRLEATFDVSFIDMDDPVSRIVMRVLAHADDTGDKAPGKALSYATKYAILKVLSLESGDADEGRIADGKAELSPQQVADFYILMDEADSIKALTVAWQKAVAVADEIGDADSRQQFTDRAGKLKAKFAEAARKVKEDKQ